MPKDLHFVIYLPGDWDVEINRQHLIRALAEEAPGSRFLCLERPVDLVTTHFLHPLKFFRWILRRNNCRREKKNLFICQTFMLLHDHAADRFSPFLRINRFLMEIQVRSLMRKFGLHPDRIVSWIYDPFQEMYLGLINEHLSVYRCYDEYSAWPSTPIFRTRSDIREREKRILGRVDVVFVLSRTLLHSKATFSDRVYLVPSAVDVKHFERAAYDSTVVPEDTKHIPHPIVGFLGHITNRIDFPLLEYIAKSHTNWSIVLVGGNASARGLDRMEKLPNVYLLGARPYEKVSDYLKTFDVCIIPYDADNPWNANCSPLKLYEYLATGKPIVSTYLPAVREFGELVRIAMNHETFEEHLISALAEDDKALCQRRIACAAQNSWRGRALKVLRVLNQRLEERQ